MSDQLPTLDGGQERREVEGLQQQLKAAREESVQARHAQALAEDAGRLGQLLLAMSEALTATTTVAEIAATITDVVVPQLSAAGGGLLLANKARTRLDFIAPTDRPADTAIESTSSISSTNSATTSSAVGTDSATAWAHIGWCQRRAKTDPFPTDES